MNYATKIDGQTDVVKIVSRYVPLKKRGGLLLGRCPFCGSKRETMAVDGARQLFYCYACGKSGNAVYFVAEYTGCSFSEALDLLSEREGLVIDEKDLEARKERLERRGRALRACRQAQWVFYSALRSEEGKKCREYFLSRGLDDATMNRFGLGYAAPGRRQLIDSLIREGFDEETLLDAGLAGKNEYGKLYDRFRDRAMFPITDEFDRVVGFGGRAIGDGTPKYLNSPESIVFDKSSCLYGFAAALKDGDPKSPVIVCEGYMDAIALKRAGYGKAVAPLGTALTDGQRNMIAGLGADVTLSYDSDEAGRKATRRALEIFEATGIETKSIDLSPYKDPDEALHKAGVQALRDKVSAAVPTYVLKARAETEGLDGAALVKALAETACAAPEGKPRQDRIKNLACEFGVKAGLVENEALLIQAERILGIAGKEETGA